MENKTKICPFCGEEININAKKCKHCGEWLEEEKTEVEEQPKTKNCPFCGEEININAKKCKHCGEWIENNPNNKTKTFVEVNLNQNMLSQKKRKIKNNLKNKHNKKLVICFSISFGILLILFIVLFSVYLYVPDCNNKTITNKLYKQILVTNPDIQNFVLDIKSAQTLSKLDRGYTCSIDGTIENAPVHFEYNYKKISLLDFNIESKPVLPTCYASQVKQLLKDLVKESSLYNISQIGTDFYTDNETIEHFDKDKPCYKCKATINISSKPGTAFVLDSWDVKNAERDIKCNLGYKTYFCNNGFTTCVALDDIYNCEYKKD